MKNRDTRVLDSYSSAIGAAGEGKQSPEIAASRNRLIAVKAEIAQCASAQSLAKGDKTTRIIRRKIDQLRSEIMIPLARHGLRLFRGDAGIEKAMRVPHKRALADEILAAATLMAKALQPHRALLRSAEVDPAQITRLRTDAQQLRKEIRAADAANADRAVPTRRIEDLMKTARLEFRLLEALVTAQGSTDAKLHWQANVRVRKRVGRPRKRKTAARPLR